MSEVVTIGVPVYRRLHYIHRALHSVAAQDYPHIELLVSDNGQNGERLEKLVAAHYPHPYRLRRNEESVNIAEHFNQIVAEATGRYFILLADDDELSPNYVSSLLAILKAEPDVGLALSRLEVIDESDQVVADAVRGQPPPPRIDAESFVRIWCTGEYRFICFTTFAARTEEILAAGGYPNFPKGTSIDNALLLKLSLGRQIAFVPHTVFRYRVYEASYGLSMSWRDLAVDLTLFLEFLDNDPVLQEYRSRHPRVWRELRALLIRMTWRTYRSRWKRMYRRRLSPGEWVRAGFAMPLIPEYYGSVVTTVVRTALAATRRKLRGVARIGSENL